MRRRMMKSKIHRATVTDANLDYVGSISLDPRLMELADIVEYEQVAVLDIDNGARFETYAIVGGPGEVCLNGAAARLVHKGDKVIVLTYADYEDTELEGFVPKIVHVDSSNTPTADTDDASADDADTDGRLSTRPKTRLDAELSGIGIS
jgi:aspartate 1-decarboxylase